MTIRVETNEYQFSHGRKPRGRGFWIFEATVKSRSWVSDWDHSIGKVDDRDQWSFGGVGTYTEVKKSAIKAAKEDGIECNIKAMP